MPSSFSTVLLGMVRMALEKRVGELEAWLAIFTALVVLGLLYEYGYDIAAFKKPQQRSFKWVLKLEKLGAILVTVGVAGELYVEMISVAAQEAVTKFNETTVAGLNLEIIKARGDAESSNEQLALRLELEKQNTLRAQRALKGDLDTEKAKHEARHVSPREAACMEKALIGMKGQPIKIGYWPTKESKAFAFDIARVFAQRSGIKIQLDPQKDEVAMIGIMVSGGGTKEFGDAVILALSCSRYGPPDGGTNPADSNPVEIYIFTDSSRSAK
jgi:hypothetical protein